MAKRSGNTRGSSSASPTGLSNSSSRSNPGEGISARGDRDIAFDRMYSSPAGSVVKGSITNGVGDYYELGGKNAEEVRRSLDSLEIPGLNTQARYLVASSLSDNIATINIDGQGLRGGQMSLNMGNTKYYARYGSPYANDRIDTRNADSIHTARTREEAWRWIKNKFIEANY